MTKPKENIKCTMADLSGISSANRKSRGTFRLVDILPIRLETILYNLLSKSSVLQMHTLDDLIERDKQREEDGFPKRIKLGKIVKPVKGKKGKVIVVPTTTEPKFNHDDSIMGDSDEVGSTGGSGKGEEGEVIGKQPIDNNGNQGEGQGAGQGSGGDHELTSEAFDLGRILHEQFNLPNLKVKGSKKAFAKYRYELTDRNRGFGQLLDKKESLKRIIQTNIMLGNIDLQKEINPADFIVSPDSMVYRIMSREKEFESQALVFFVRDYSGSMYGNPTEAVCSQHLLVYSWLMYQYKNRVKTRFILHDTDAKEVSDFYTYYKSAVAGGTQIYPAFEMVSKIIKAENLAVDYNIYILYGTDGDDWDKSGDKVVEELKKLTPYVNRIGLTVVRNSYSAGVMSTFENYIIASGLLRTQIEKIRMDVFTNNDFDEPRLIEGIKKLFAQ